MKNTILTAAIASALAIFVPAPSDGVKLKPGDTSPYFDELVERIEHRAAAGDSLSLTPDEVAEVAAILSNAADRAERIIVERDKARHKVARLRHKLSRAMQDG